MNSKHFPVSSPTCVCSGPFSHCSQADTICLQTKRNNRRPVRAGLRCLSQDACPVISRPVPFRDCLPDSWQAVMRICNQSDHQLCIIFNEVQYRWAIATNVAFGRRSIPEQLSGPLREFEMRRSTREQRLTMPRQHDPNIQTSKSFQRINEFLPAS